MLRLVLSLLLAVAAAGSARAADPDAVPYINADGQKVYQRYLLEGLQRAFAISEHGGYGGGWSWSTLEGATKTALDNCRKRDPQGPCKLYSLGGYVVWGKDPATIPRYADAPKLGLFIPSDYYPVRGPQAAKGLVVWSHGYQAGFDATATQPHAYVSRLFAAGWDVYRYNRQWIDQMHMEIQGMLESVAAAKSARYRKVILAGHSHGGWISLEALARGVPVDGVIADAMAHHGKPPNPNARSDFRQLLSDIRGRGAPIPVVFLLFQNDGFDPGGRFADIPGILGGSPVPFHLIDRPEGLSGHGAGSGFQFNDRFGACIVRFVTASPPTFGDCK